ncbi:hypothetical protein K9K77_01115 [Candidatus Babeliales bacterium]|nr:hypothetical protein [Candidatus Babeliales bacterium]
MKQKFFKGIIFCIMIPFFTSALSDPDKKDELSDSERVLDRGHNNVQNSRRILRRMPHLSPSDFLVVRSGDAVITEQSSERVIVLGSRIASTHKLHVQKTNRPGR